jgi:uncharacterized membrane protein YkoI
MFSTARKTVATIGALGALALGGSAIAGAAQSGSASTSSTASATPSAQQGRPPNGGRPGGRHVGANGKQEQPLSGDTAAKVKAAALKKVTGGTVERVETDVDHGSPYEAHVRKADGTQLEVLVNKSFEVTAVNQMQHP